MRQQILNSVLKKTESLIMDHRSSDYNNPTYEDPKDIGKLQIDNGNIKVAYAKSNIQTS